ncbi:TIGR00730 family Rossman fold protein [Methylocystis echinoides]|uniref:AMP nucleosidase n=1 Tax=Methylocystis echinoides TaxID=29468 RepID=A0A9W6GR53_9HYPH|nr:TIGR00730 family Rossman fold protein [Methylocystis echinoides]GLI91390.1 hypothetical protein LMG27198_03820 [Methylocystis echinoides]
MREEDPPPLRRQEPLPDQQPKPLLEDPEAARRLAALLTSPSYREADSDFDFLNSDAARGPRLELDYLKAETLLRQHGVTDSIVVFGSTRIAEPQAAQARLAEAQAFAAAHPDDPEAARRARVAERLAEKAHYYDVAREFGRIVGACCELPDGRRLAIVTGGGPGVMEAANRGAYDVGAPTVGLNISLPHEQFPNPYVTPELCFRFHYFAMRKLHFVLRARALVAFPGGYGTLDELFETLTLAQTRVMKPLPIVLVGEKWWRRVFDTDFLVEEGVIAPEDQALFSYAETAGEIWENILRWRQKAGGPLL